MRLLVILTNILNNFIDIKENVIFTLIEKIN